MTRTFRTTSGTIKQNQRSAAKYGSYALAQKLLRIELATVPSEITQYSSYAVLHRWPELHGVYH
jgi:hypothetical protein